MTEGPSGITIASPMLAEYAEKGSLFLRGTVAFALPRLLGEARTLETSLPAQSIVTLTEQSHYVVPQGQELPFTQEGEQFVFTVLRLQCRQMAALKYEQV